MDSLYHIQQGQKLLEKKDASSIKKALEHFKIANEMTESENIQKPKVLYYLAFGNLIIGNIEQSYKIAHKAKRSIDIAIQNSSLSMNNMRQMLGEGDIVNLIIHINKKYPELVLFTDLEDENFDENILDFSHVSKLYHTIEKQEFKPQFSIDQLNDRILTATFVGLGRPDDKLVYFDKLKGDVLCYLQGYLSSLVADQSTEDLRFVNRIRNKELTDYVDEDRYILIDRLPLTKFLKEYKKQTKGKEPFLSFVDYFSVKTLERYHWYDFYENDEDFNDSGYNEDQCVTIKDLTIGSNLHEEFSTIFGEKYPDRFDELVSDYRNIFESTMKAVALKWIRKNVFK